MMMEGITKQCVLVAGGTGLIGSRLCKMLSEAGHEVRILSRKEGKKKSRFETFSWNPSDGYIDNKALDGATAVINLAGTGIADHRWTKKYKQEILNSRIESVRTLINAIRNHDAVRVYVGASALGYYGNRGDEVLNEQSSAGVDFLANTTEKWEAASTDCPARRVIIRTGIVLSTRGGALPSLARPVRAMITPIIDGRQFMSWIHIDDLCRMYIAAVENENWKGVFNATSPSSKRNREFLLTIKEVINPNSLVLNIPTGVIRFLLGEQSSLILNSARVVPEHASAMNFEFRYPDLKEALKSLYVF